MIVNNKIYLFVFTALVTSACASGYGPPHRGERRGGPSGHPESRLILSSSDRIQLQLTNTALKLKLTLEQQQLWYQYESKVRLLLMDDRRIEQRKISQSNAVKKINRKVDDASNYFIDMQDIAKAAREFYDSLNYGQKQVADTELPKTFPTLKLDMESGLDTRDSEKPDDTMYGPGNAGGPNGGGRPGGMSRPGDDIGRF